MELGGGRKDKQGKETKITFPKMSRSFRIGRTLLDLPWNGPSINKYSSPAGREIKGRTKEFFVGTVLEKDAYRKILSFPRSTESLLIMQRDWRQ